MFEKCLSQRERRMRGNMMIKYLYQSTLEDRDSILEISLKLWIKNGLGQIRTSEDWKSETSTQNTDEWKSEMKNVENNFAVPIMEALSCVVNDFQETENIVFFFILLSTQFNGIG